MTATGIVLTRKLLASIANNTITPYAQDNQIAPTIYKRVRADDACLRPDQQNARSVYDIIRAHNESDPNTYVEKAYIEIGNHRIVIDRASLTKPSIQSSSKAWDLTGQEYTSDQLFDMAHETNNQLASTFLVAADAKPIYLTRFLVRCK